WSPAGWPVISGDRPVRGGSGGPDGGAVRRDGGAAGQELTGVLEQDDAVAQQAPPLLGVAGQGAGGFAVRCVRRRTDRVVRAHRRASEISLDGSRSRGREPFGLTS